MTKPALKLVEKAPIFEEGELWSSSSDDYHSLHFSISYPESFRPGIPALMIDRYSKPGDVVLDPFAGRGTTALEAAIKGRIPFTSDINPLAVMISQAKVNPADLTEVALELQRLDLRRPVGINSYKQFFEPFYDIDTFREIANLRSALIGREDRVGRFLTLVTLSLLHGHTAGYLSTYTFPQISVSPKVQVSINDKRRQNPEYRAVMPRILRKAAQILRDGIAAPLREAGLHGRFAVCDARNLSFIPAGLVTLTVAAPPRPGTKDSVLDLWLRLWFAGIEKRDRDELMRQAFAAEDLDNWLDFMNEFLTEQARIVRSSGRVVLELKDIEVSGSLLRLDQALAAMVEQDLSSYWEIEAFLAHSSEEHIASRIRSRRTGNNTPVETRLVVLRRR